MGSHPFCAGARSFNQYNNKIRKVSSEKFKMPFLKTSQSFVSKLIHFKTSAGVLFILLILNSSPGPVFLSHGKILPPSHYPDFKNKSLTRSTVNDYFSSEDSEQVEAPYSADTSLGANDGGFFENLLMGGTGESTYQGLLPFTESGICKAGVSYRIVKAEDLLRFGHELECVFFSGISPTKIPLGPLYGTVLSVLNTEQFSPMINMIWWGKLLTQVPCPPTNGEKPHHVYIGWNNLLSTLMVPFVSSLGPIMEHLPPGEFNDGRTNVMIDYTQDFSRVCDPPLKEFRGDVRGYQDLDDYGDIDGAGDEAVTNIYPLNQIVDALRLVGKQMDGGRIYLGKTYLRDSFRWSSTVLYFYFVNYDDGVNPEFPKGASLPPLAEDFTYTMVGVSRMVL